MTIQEFQKIEAYMLDMMKDSAHDRHHIDRVLHFALDIAGTETGADMDVLLAACLLHDIGRERQAENPELCHAETGGDMAYEYLLKCGWSLEKARHVKACVASHRYRRNNAPESIEAKILFDADKLDATGVMGIARTLIYGGQIGEPLYILDQDGNILTEETDAERTTFFQEYHYKLKRLYGAFYTDRARQLAAEHRKNAEAFYSALFSEIDGNRKAGARKLREVLT
ncbi:MAG TPA: HD domain-containing protein [Feifaniaceae bacterium]|nr:HD domain-containing protein [Feifaniaceae bacterium]